MSVIPQLASSLNRRDEVPNQELARQIALHQDKVAVLELVSHLSHKSKDIQHDCIKVLYEVGALAPGLIADQVSTFADLLSSKNNRLQWGAMTALHSIIAANPGAIYNILPGIIAAMERGSVITKDYGMYILIDLGRDPAYAENTFALLLEQLLKSLPNQLPLYAEKAVAVINNGNKDRFVKALTTRLPDLDKESKRKRVEKVIRKVSR
ncbi:MAG: hypothetical protein H6581_00150 [Bacteroidia bacterium]|nr:hypothetical protein [Bacteroidia bacterium]